MPECQIDYEFTMSKLNNTAIFCKPAILLAVENIVRHPQMFAAINNNRSIDRKF